MGSGLHWILFLLENIRKEQCCHVSRYQILKVRIGVEGKMAYQMKNNAFLKLSLVVCHVLSDVWTGKGCRDLIESLHSRWRWMVSFVFWSLHPQGKSPQYPLCGRLIWAPALVWSYTEKKNLYLVLCPVLPACSWIVAYWLKYIDVLAFINH